MFGYRREIDGLRALAVAPVILFHAGFEAFSGGFVGVDVFFVISGYLITSIILTQKAAGTFSLLDFYERRARRILPALFLVMAVCIPFAWLWLLPSDMKDFSRSLVAVSVFASNILFWRESGYFDTAAELKPLLHTWSLAVEEQYYLLFPLFLLVMWRFAKRWTVATLAVIAALSFALAQWGAYNRPASTFFLLPTRGWEIAIGALIAFYFARYPKLQLQRPAQEVGSLIGLSLILYAVFAYSKATPFPSAYALAPTLGTALIILCTTPSTFVGRVLTTKLFVGVGLISYSAYLWHQPLFAFTRHRFGDGFSTSLVWWLIGITLLLAVFTWQLIETPVRKNRKISKRFIFSSAFALSVLFISLGFYGHFKYNELSQYRFDKGQLMTISSASNSAMRPLCHFPQIENSLEREACRYFADNVSVAVFGNSHATELAEAVAETLRERNIGIVHHTMSGCNHNYRVKPEVDTVCAKWHRKVFAELVDETAIRYVVLSYRNEGSLSNEMYRTALSQLANDLNKAGKKVFLVLQAPRPEQHINQYLRASLHNLQISIKGRSVADWRKLYADAQMLIDNLDPQIDVLDPTSLFCDMEDCYVSIDGVALFFDGHHMSVAGARIVAKELVRLGLGN